MSNNLHRVQNIFISNADALPVNDAAITTLTAGQIGIFGRDMKALNPSGADTITTQPSIYIVESKTDASGISYPKRSMKIDGANVISYDGKPFAAAKRESWAIGYDRKLAVGAIEVNNASAYQFSIVFKNDKTLYSNRQEVLRVNFISIAAATQLSIATQVFNSILNSSFISLVTPLLVGNGTGVHGLTGATNYGVEITAKDIDQMLSTTYTLNHVYFSVHVDDSTGFGSTTTCTRLQAMDPGVGTYTQVYNMENFDFQYEGVVNRTTWPIPVLDFAATTTLTAATITPTVSGTIGEDKVTFSATVAAILNVGDKIVIGGVTYEIKYFISATVAVLTSNLLATAAAAAVTVKYKYDLIVIEFNDVTNGPTGTMAVANKSIVIAVPSVDVGDAYDGLSLAGTDVKAILDGWMASTPRAFANITI